MKRPLLVIFASGSKESGGSGFENLAKSSELDAEIVAVVSNYEHGGVRIRAERLGVPFIYFPGPYTAAAYHAVLDEAVLTTGRIWVALSGWLKKVEGLDPASTINIHPALLSFQNRRFGGAGLYGYRVHDKVKAALDAGEITESGCTMHFVTSEYDGGPVFFENRVSLEKGMSAEEIARAVHDAEHAWQPRITNLVVQGEISWDGKNAASLRVPENYEYLPKML